MEMTRVRPRGDMDDPPAQEKTGESPEDCDQESVNDPGIPCLSLPIEPGLEGK